MRPLTDALLVIDVQRDFCSGGALEVPGGEDVVGPINAMLPDFAVRVFSQDWHPEGHSSFVSEHPGRSPMETVQMPYGEQILWPDHCIQGSQGAEFHPDLELGYADVIVRKGFRRAIDSYSAFFENDHETPTGLGGYLRERGVKRVVVVGLALDVCVNFTAVDAAALGFETEVVAEACRAIDMDGSLERARQAMDRAGVRTTGSG